MRALERLCADLVQNLSLPWEAYAAKLRQHETTLLGKAKDKRQNEQLALVHKKLSMKAAHLAYQQEIMNATQVQVLTLVDAIANLAFLSTNQAYLLTEVTRSRKVVAQYEEVATPSRRPPSVSPMSPPAKQRCAVGVNDIFAAESSPDVEDADFVPSSQSLPSDDDSGSGDDAVGSGSKSCLRRAFDAAFEARDAEIDTVLKSGKSVESLLHAMGHHESEEERLAEIWWT
ncbi:hypothetical protein HDU87_003327 [Geranomyces variabilis]|uniref:Uncharacterized protein n=1 Tax=Geranomyces variabilis TaxID=109894 RepID=A0AAD5TK21_9FUNG|nr:hypothetical protein HDU87_003327 [Geranomyces variabilis]